MLKKTGYYFLIGITLLFIGFQIYTFLHTMFYMEASAVPGEEDVVVRNGNTEENRLTFTCNVDWGEEIIPGMLEILKEKDIEITFFVSGKWAEKNPYLLRTIYIMGHEIQNHGYAHKLCSQISPDKVREEIQKTEDAINELTGIKTTVFAPPSGDYNADTVKLCREMGYTLSLWSSDTIDWRKDSTASVIKDRILRKPLKGAIILMHPKEETLKALPELIDEIRKQGIEIVTLNQLLQYCACGQEGI